MALTRSLVTFLILVVTLAIPASLAQARGATEHGVIKPMPGATLADSLSKTLDFSSYEFRITQGSKTVMLLREGKYWFLKYEILKADGKLDKSVSAVEIVENYKNAAREKGGKVHYDKNKKLTFSLPREDGGTTWAHLQASDGRYDIHIVDVAGMTQQLNFGAEEMALELDALGSIKVYGIHFDVDSDKLILGSEKVLIELVKLLKNNPGLRVEISGHTDNTGSAAHNLDLSKRRASTVAAFLEMYGVDPGRMVSKGYGEDNPVSPNDTEDGRALNRRVELKKLN